MTRIKLDGDRKRIKLTQVGKRGPQGIQGIAATIQIGQTTTVSPGSPASVVNVGNPNDAILDFEIPQGIQGPVGEGVEPGGTAGQVLRKETDSDYDTEWHTPTKSDVGLGNVPNLDTTQAVNQSHTHSNKSVLDATSASYTAAEKDKLATIEHGAQVNTVDSVNGHTGEVVLDADDLEDVLTNKKFVSQAEKDKLAGIAAGAEVNVQSDWNASSGDAHILNKPTLGTAAATAATDYATAAQGARADTAVQPATLTAHTSNTSNPHGVTKAQVGLGNVSNLAPADMPVSTAQQTALDGKVDSRTLTNTIYGVDSNGNQHSTQKPYILVAASDTVARVKSRADFICTGTDDQTVINAAMLAAYDSLGGRVVLARGTFNLSSHIEVISGVSLEGMTIAGSTTLRLADGSTSFAIRALNKNDVTIKNLTVDGNHPNRGVNTNATILLQNSFDVRVSNVKMSNLMHHGFEVSYGSYNIVIEDCVVDTTSGDGIEIEKTQTPSHTRKDIVINRCKFLNLGALSNPQIASGRSGAEFEYWCAAEFNDCEFENMDGFSQVKPVASEEADKSILVDFNRCTFRGARSYYNNILANQSNLIDIQLTFRGCRFDGSGMTEGTSALFRIYSQATVNVIDSYITNVPRIYRHQSSGGSSALTLDGVTGVEVGGVHIIGTTPFISVNILNSNLKYMSPGNPLYSMVPIDIRRWLELIVSYPRQVTIRNSILSDAPHYGMFLYAAGSKLEISNSSILNHGFETPGTDNGMVQVPIAAVATTKTNISNNNIQSFSDYVVRMDNGFSNSVGSTEFTVSNNRFDTAIAGIRNLDIARQLVNNPLFKYSEGASRNGFILSGSGSPEGSVEATVGIVYSDISPVSNTGVWVKASGVGATGWSRSPMLGDLNLKVDKAGDTMTGPLGATNITALGGNASYNGGYPTYTLNNGSKKWDIYETGDGSMVFRNTTDNLAPITIRANTPQPMLELYSGGVQLLSSLIPRANGTGSIGMENFRFANVQTLKVTVNGPFIVSGTGFPNGVVSAPVGSTYIDTAATNGAIEWKKATGTGPTGWVVSVGDTGWRDISSILLNGWTGALMVRRIGGTVYIQSAVDPSAITSNEVYRFPVGLRSTGFGVLYSMSYAGASGSPVSSVYRTYLDIYGFLRIPNATTSFPVIHTEISVPGDNSWPSTLPGTAA